MYVISTVFVKNEAWKENTSLKKNYFRYINSYNTKPINYKIYLMQRQ